MSDDYLWDKSGEPDKDVEQLEQLLGNLRYRRPSSPLPLPRRVPVGPRRIFTPALAIAAALLFVTVAAGVWFTFGARQPKEAAGIATVNVQAGRAQEWLNPDSLFAIATQEKTQQTNPPEQGLVATSSPSTVRPRRLPASNRRGMTEARIAKSSPPNRAEEISEDEGVAAREQLLKALHLASSKLHQVQKKVKDNKELGPVS